MKYRIITLIGLAGSTLAVCFGGDFLSGLYELFRNRQKCICGKITGASGTAECTSSVRECSVAVGTRHPTA